MQKDEGVNVKTVVVDKDASEIGAVRQTTPDCNIILCRSHVAKTLYEAVRKYCTRGEQEEVMGFVRRMMVTASEEEFFICFSSVPDGQFKTYLVKNWLPVYHTWANYKTKNMLTWGNKTNNFVERRNMALKTVTVGHSKMNIAEFIRSLLAYHKTTERAVRRKLQKINLRSKISVPNLRQPRGFCLSHIQSLLPMHVRR